MFAALCAVAVAGVAALFVMVRADPSQTVATPPSDFACGRNGRGRKRCCGTALAPIPETASPTAPARRAAAAPKAKGAAPAPEKSRVAVSPARAPQRTTAVAENPVETCKDKIFLLKEFCLAEQCEKPGSRNHPLCVKHREEARLREDSRVRN